MPVLGAGRRGADVADDLAGAGLFSSSYASRAGLQIHALVELM